METTNTGVSYYGPLRPIIYTMAIFGCHHFRRGPYAGTILARFTIAWNILVLMIIMTFLVFITIMQGTESSYQIYKYNNILTSSASFIYSLFLFYIAWKPPKFHVFLHDWKNIQQIKNSDIKVITRKPFLFILVIGLNNLFSVLGEHNC